MESSLWIDNCFKTLLINTLSLYRIYIYQEKETEKGEEEEECQDRSMSFSRSTCEEGEREDVFRGFPSPLFFVFVTVDTKHSNHSDSSWSCSADREDNSRSPDSIQCIESNGRIYNSPDQQRHSRTDRRNILGEKNTSISLFVIDPRRTYEIDSSGRCNPLDIDRRRKFPKWWFSPRRRLRSDRDQRSSDPVCLKLDEKRKMTNWLQWKMHYQWVHSSDRRNLTQEKRNVTIVRFLFEWDGVSFTIDANTLLFDSILIGRSRITDATIGTNHILTIALS